MADKSFPITGGAAPLYILMPIALLMFAIAAGFIYFVVGPKHLTVGGGSLEVSGAIYGTSVARDKVLADQVRVVDLGKETELAPGSRSNGVDLFSYREGWFKLHNGEKAFVVVSDPTSVVYVPTSAGFAILFSPSDPAKAVAALH
jgi:hypothetical protein